MTQVPERLPDQAALLGVALAATVSITAAEGPWEPIESIVGLVLVVIVGAYHDLAEVRRERGGLVRRIALASVLALCCCLVVAWPLQSINLNLYWWLPGTWSVVVVAVLWYLRSDRSRRTNRQAAISSTVQDDDRTAGAEPRREAAFGPYGQTAPQTATEVGETDPAQLLANDRASAGQPERDPGDPS
ncbi:hypothetical protein [Micromonospora sp. 067-2]|uniref:hypothetical protein n=1 Tax=Micromonospora sp. 067-2 TaxID=2789270 RepID=UPI00397A9DB1